MSAPKAQDYTIKILMEPEIRGGEYFVRETWSGPYEGLGNPYPMLHGPMPAEIVAAFMKERVMVLETYKKKWRADFEQRVRTWDDARDGIF